MTMLLGIPYLRHGRTRDGVDCWGLIYLRYLQLRRPLPSFASDYADPLDRDRRMIELLINQNKHLFEQIAIEDAVQDDVLLFNIFGSPSHIALYLRHQFMLNADSKAGVVMERYDSPKWAPRLEGAYRYVGQT